jgi:hypothetical protein
MVLPDMLTSGGLGQEPHVNQLNCGVAGVATERVGEIDTTNVTASKSEKIFLFIFASFTGNHWLVNASNDLRISRSAERAQRSGALSAECAG